MRSRGRKTVQWERVRRELKKRFERVGITSCEIRLPQCWKGYALAFCHTKRRADIKSISELERVVLGCAACATACEVIGIFVLLGDVHGVAVIKPRASRKRWDRPSPPIHRSWEDEPDSWLRETPIDRPG